MSQFKHYVYDLARFCTLQYRVSDCSMIVPYHLNKIGLDYRMCTVLNETAGIDALEVSKLHHIRLLDIMMNIIFWLNLKESGK